MLDKRERTRLVDEKHLSPVATLSVYSGAVQYAKVVPLAPPRFSLRATISSFLAALHASASQLGHHRPHHVRRLGEVQAQVLECDLVSVQRRAITLEDRGVVLQCTVVACQRRVDALHQPVALLKLLVDALSPVV